MLLLLAALVLLAHSSVVLIERPKASRGKALALVAIFIISHNIALHLLPELSLAVEWAIYIGFTSLAVWAIFRLKPINNLIVGSIFVVGRWLLGYLLSLAAAVSFNA